MRPAFVGKLVKKLSISMTNRETEDINISISVKNFKPCRLEYGQSITKNVMLESLLMETVSKQCYNLFTMVSREVTGL